MLIGLTDLPVICFTWLLADSKTLFSTLIVLFMTIALSVSVTDIAALPVLVYMFESSILTFQPRFMQTGNLFLPETLQLRIVTQPIQGVLAALFRFPLYTRNPPSQSFTVTFSINMLSTESGLFGSISIAYCGLVPLTLVIVHFLMVTPLAFVTDMPCRRP